MAIQLRDAKLVPKSIIRTIRWGMRPLIILISTAALLPGPNPLGEVALHPLPGQGSAPAEEILAPAEAILAPAVAIVGPTETMVARAGIRVAGNESTAVPGLAHAAIALVIFGNDTVRAEVANTSALRSRGLMDREELPNGTGMLFVWENEGMRSFWMRNTLVALDVAFIDRDFEIVDIQQMEPETTNTHNGANPAMYALEVPQGWFTENGITVGDRCEVIFSQ